MNKSFFCLHDINAIKMQATQCYICSQTEKQVFKIFEETLLKLVCAVVHVNGSCSQH